MILGPFCWQAAHVSELALPAIIEGAVVQVGWRLVGMIAARAHKTPQVVAELECATRVMLLITDFLAVSQL